MWSAGLSAARVQARLLYQRLVGSPSRRPWAVDHGLCELRRAAGEEMRGPPRAPVPFPDARRRGDRRAGLQRPNSDLGFCTRHHQPSIRRPLPLGRAVHVWQTNPQILTGSGCRLVRRLCLASSGASSDQLVLGPSGILRPRKRSVRALMCGPPSRGTWVSAVGCRQSRQASVPTEPAASCSWPIRQRRLCRPSGLAPADDPSTGRDGSDAIDNGGSGPRVAAHTLTLDRRPTPGLANAAARPPGRRRRSCHRAHRRGCRGGVLAWTRRRAREGRRGRGAAQPPHNRPAVHQRRARQAGYGSSLMSRLGSKARTRQLCRPFRGSRTPSWRPAGSPGTD